MPQTLPAYSVIPPEDGKSYQWDKDQLIVKLHGDHTRCAYTLIVDNLLPDFHLPLHMHRDHSETFYILEGAVDFQLGNEQHQLGAGETVHVPPLTPHSAKTGDAARMLMIYQPSGFEQYLEELASLSSRQLNDRSLLREVAARHDIIYLE